MRNGNERNGTMSKATEGVVTISGATISEARAARRALKSVGFTAIEIETSKNGWADFDTFEAIFGSCRVVGMKSEHRVTVECDGETFSADPVDGGTLTIKAVA
jgi:hypothetical protein